MLIKGQSVPQDLVLKQGAGVLNKGRRKVFWCPTAEIDMNVALVRGDRQQFIGPGPPRVSSNEGEPREIGGHVIHVDWARVFEFQSHAL